jgi:hypothetical protein
MSKERERLVIPADKTVAAKLAKSYVSPELGTLTVKASGSATVFDLGEWRSTVATRKNDDGSMSFITVDPGTLGFEFVQAERQGRKALIVRDGQHEYVFIERS